VVAPWRARRKVAGRGGHFEFLYRHFLKVLGAEARPVDARRCGAVAFGPRRFCLPIEDLEEMPSLAELKRMTTSNA
jgi:hypothetical protein